jgi:hypothetical protein
MTSERLVWEGIFEFHVLHLAKVAAADLLESFIFSLVQQVPRTILWSIVPS